MSRGPSPKWADFREALALMQPGDELIWDVPDVHTARSYTWTHGRQSDWDVSCKALINNMDGSGRVRINRYQ